MTQLCPSIDSAQRRPKLETRAIKDLLRISKHGRTKNWDACPCTKIITNNYDLWGQVSQFNVYLP